MKIATRRHYLTSPSLIDETCRSVQLIGIGTHAPRSYHQSEIVDILGYRNNKVVELIVQNAAIETRSFYKTPLDFGANVTADDLASYHRHYAPLLAAEALHAAASSHFDLSALDALITTTSTGFMSPGIAEALYDTYGIGRLDTFRYNLAGHGCSGIIPALQIARGLILSGQARHVGVACTEAVAALFNPYSRSKMAMIQHLIFGEGGAAIILGETGFGASPYPLLLDSYETLAPNSINAVTIRQSHFWESITDRSVPNLVSKVLPGVVQTLLQRHDLTIDQIHHWAFHTGGRKILEECQACLNLTDLQMTPSYDILLSNGNMLSASALFSLHRMLHTHHPQPGDLGLLVALGPGITAGAVLMTWDY